MNESLTHSVPPSLFRSLSHFPRDRIPLRSRQRKGAGHGKRNAPYLVLPQPPNSSSNTKEPGPLYTLLNCARLTKLQEEREAAKVAEKRKEGNEREEEEEEQARESEGKQGRTVCRKIKKIG